MSHILNETLEANELSVWCHNQLTPNSPTFIHDVFVCMKARCVTKAKHVLFDWGRDKMAAISQMTLSNAFPWLKMLEFRIKFHWSLFLRVQ